MPEKMPPLVNRIQNNQEIELIIFADFVHPNGHLDWAMESHALMFYYLNAMRAYETYEIGNPIIYEGEDDPRCNYEQLFVSIASLYGVDPNKMTDRWPMIDTQVISMGFPLLPQDTKYRYSHIIKLI